MLAKIKEDEGDIAGNYCLKTQYKYYYFLYRKAVLWLVYHEVQ